MTRTCIQVELDRYGIERKRRRPHAVPARVISGYEICAACGVEVYVDGSEGTAAESLQRHEGEVSR